MQTITVNPGDEVTFSFNFLTDEATSDDDFENLFSPDTAFYTIADEGFLLADPNLSNFVPSDIALFNEETGYASFSTGPLPGGTYTLGFGIVNVGDIATSSGLLVDDVAISSGNGSGNAVPEPSTMALVCLGLTALGIGYRRAK